MCNALLVREQHKKLSALEMELASARQEGFTSKRSTETDGTHSKKRPLVVIGIFSRFGRKNNRDAIRKAWMGTGTLLLPLWTRTFYRLGRARLCFVHFILQLNMRKPGLSEVGLR